MTRFPRTTVGWKLRSLWGSFALDSWGARSGKLLSLFIIIAFSIAGAIFFHITFKQMLALEGIGEPLLWRIIGITLTTIFGLLVVSNLITGIATLYRSSEIPFLLARPVPYHKVFLSKFIDNLTYSSWSLAILGVPLVVGWGLVSGLSFWLILGLILFGLLPLVIIASEVGAALLIGLIFLAQKTSPRFTMILVTVVVLGTIGLTVSQRTEGLLVEGIMRNSTVEKYITELGTDFHLAWTPPQWLSGSMKALQKGDLSKSAFFAGLLTITAIVWLRWLTVWAGRIYYQSWTTLQDITGSGSAASSSVSANRFTKGILPAHLNAMLYKDILQFVRNPSQWAQFLLLVAFLLVYLLNLVYLAGRINFDLPFWKTLVLFLNFAFTGFILATLSVRFVFPLISLEGRGFWVVRSAPVTMELLFWEKFFLAFIVFMGLCEMIVYFTNNVLNISGPLMMVTTAATFTMGAALTGLAIGMGALFPDFSDESPMRIASTPGGVLTVVISLVYVGLMVAIIAWPTQGYFIYLLNQGPFPFGRALQALALVAGLNALVLLLPIRQGRHMLTTRDF